jgi:formate dehydrogenase subunit delta
MSITQLIKMANQIGAFFDAMPDAEQAAAGVAEHMQKFWQPRMLRTLEAHVATQGDEALTPIVRRALLRIRSGTATGS